MPVAPSPDKANAPSPIRHSGKEAEIENEAAHQAELQRRAALVFAEVDAQPREPGAALTDPAEREWAEGVEEKARRMGLKL